jgi:hypothetical protein
MSAITLCPPAASPPRHRQRKSPDRPASRPRTTAAWARDTRRNSKRSTSPTPSTPSTQQASNKPLRTITPQAAGVRGQVSGVRNFLKEMLHIMPSARSIPHSAVRTPQLKVRTPQLKVLWPYIGAAAAVFALALNVRTVLAVFMSAVEVLR